MGSAARDMANVPKVPKNTDPAHKQERKGENSITWAGNALPPLDEKAAAQTYYRNRYGNHRQTAAKVTGQAVGRN